MEKITLVSGHDISEVEFNNYATGGGKFFQLPLPELEFDLGGYHIDLEHITVQLPDGKHPQISVSWNCTQNVSEEDEDNPDRVMKEGMMDIDLVTGLEVIE